MNRQTQKENQKLKELPPERGENCANPHVHFEPIGILSTCFKEKFGIPRQPGLIPHASGILKLKDHPFFKSALRELDGFSHLWLIFLFHQHDAKNWKPSIRPPRLGGAKKVGVLASRSPHRPNPIGISAVKLEKIDWNAPEGIEIHLSGVDCLDGTPVLDIKPYIPYADSIPQAQTGWAQEPIDRIAVEFSEKALTVIISQALEKYPFFKEIAQGMLELDPRPAFQKKHLPAQSKGANGTRYGFKLFEFDIQWQIRDGKFIVLDVVEGWGRKLKPLCR